MPESKEQRNVVTALIARARSLFRAPRLYTFLMTVRPFMGKYFFLVLCIIGLILYTVYSWSIIRRLEEEAVAVTQTYAELIRTALSEHMNYREMNVIFEEIIQKSQNPIIITDTAWNPIMWQNVTDRSLFSRKEIEPRDTSEEARSKIEKKIIAYRKMYDPKMIYISDTDIKIGYLVFGNSTLVNSLALMPFMAIGIIAAFSLFAYLGFHNIRVTERSNLWVGLAKETAHQLGTPISSLMGWVEYMKSVDDADDPVDPEAFRTQIHSICDNMENDLARLRKVTNRFSKIGSQPSLQSCDINSVLEDSMKYFNMRLPFIGKNISVDKELSSVPPVAANRELIEWVFENLLKNAIDAIQARDGKISIRTEHVDVEKVVRVYHGDNGKGVGWEDQKKIFSPGYTTKKRGWGLGLTLAKRIIEDYHKGRIYINWSQKGKGTVFCVDLPVVREPDTAVDRLAS